MQRKQDEPMNPFKIEEEMRKRQPNLFALDSISSSKKEREEQQKKDKAYSGIMHPVEYAHMKLKVCRDIYGWHEVPQKGEQMGEPWITYNQHMRDLKTKIDILTELKERGKISEEEIAKEQYLGLYEAVKPFLDNASKWPREWRDDDINTLIKECEEVYETDIWTKREALMRSLLEKRKACNSLEWAINKMEE